MEPEIAQLHISRKLHLVLVAVLLAAVLAGFALSLKRSHLAAYPAATQYPPSVSLNPAALTAEAAVIYDATNGRTLFSKNDEEQLPLASVTKLMTATAALNDLAPSSPVPITAQAIATEGDSGLHAGEVWKASDLLKYALLVSSNDGMAAVAQAAGRDKLLSQMNDEAQKLGLAQSYFLDPTGLDLTTGVSGAYGSARDVAVLAAHFLKDHPEYFQATLQSGVPFGSGGQALRGKGTAEPIFDLPGLIGAKTGYTDLAGGNLVAAFDIGLAHPVVAVVLHSTEQGRFADMRTLIEAAQAAAAASTPSITTP